MPWVTGTYHRRNPPRAQVGTCGAVDGRGLAALNAGLPGDAGPVAADGLDPTQMMFSAPASVVAGRPYFIVDMSGGAPDQLGDFVGEIEFLVGIC